MNRRIMTLDISEGDLLDPIKCLNAVKSAVSEFFQAEGECSRIQTEFRKYLSIPKDSNASIPLINKWKYLADTSSKAFLSDFPEIIPVSSKTSKAEKNRINEANRLMVANGYEEELSAISLDSAICGKGFAIVYTEDDSDFPKMKELDPTLSFVVYDCSFSKKPLFGVTISKLYQVSDSSYSVSYSVNAYGKNWIRVYSMSPTSSSSNIFPTFGTIPTAGLGSISEKTESFKSGLGFGFVPIVEFDNNIGLVGDSACVDSIISVFNDFQTKRFANINKIVDALLVLKNVDIGTDEKSKTSMKEQLDAGILAIKSQEGKDSDAKYLTNPLNQEQMHVLAHEAEIAIHKISCIPDFQDKEFTENVSAPVLSIKTKPLRDLVETKEKPFSYFFKRIIAIIQNLDLFYKKDSGIDFDLSRTTFRFSHTMPSNDTEICTQMVALNNAGALNVEQNVGRLSFVKNLDSYIEGISDKVDKPLGNTQNNIVNETNSTREALAKTDQTGGNRVNELAGQAK